MNELAVFPGATSVPAHVLQRLGTVSAVPFMVSEGGVSVPRISLKGNRFHKIKDGDTDTLAAGFMEVAIVGSTPTVSRMLWKDAYDASADAKLPDCWSTDGRSPDAGVKNPQSTGCTLCPMNAKGSGSGTTKACSYKKRLMIVDANEPDTVYQLDVSAMSIFGDDDIRAGKFSLTGYAKHLAKVNCPNPVVLVTRVEFDTRASVPKLLFQPVDYWSPEEDARIAQTMETNKTLIENQTRLIISIGDSSERQAAPTPPAQGRTRMAAQDSGPAQHSGTAAAQPAPAQQASAPPAAPTPPAATPPQGRMAAQAAAPIQGEVVNSTPFDAQTQVQEPPKRARMGASAAPVAAMAATQTLAAPTETVGSIDQLNDFMASLTD